MSKASATAALGQYRDPDPLRVTEAGRPSLEREELARVLDPSLSRKAAAFERWKYQNPDAQRVPAQHESHLLNLQRHLEASRFKVTDPEEARQVEAIRAQLESDLPAMNRRKEMERELADYIEREAAPFGPIRFRSAGQDRAEDLYDLAVKLRDCRKEGPIGLKPGGGFIRVYDDKCSDVKLCPHESRQETQRLMQRYIPAVREWKQAHRGNAFQFAVFTLPNYEPGDLAAGKKDIMDRFAKLRERKCMENVAGGLVIQEDPLSARGDWNVHLNVILLVDGHFDWAAVREAWGGNIHFEGEDGLRSKTRQKLHQRGQDAAGMDDLDVLTHAFMELAKYAGAPASSKSAQKADDGQSAAPAMTDWPAELWREWRTANKAFRRTRGFGVLHVPEAFRWDNADEGRRQAWLRAAELPEALWRSPWRRGEDKLTKDQTDLLKPVMNAREKLDLGDVVWVGSMRFIPGEGYRVRIDLIPEDKSGSGGGRGPGDSPVMLTGPPPDPWGSDISWEEWG